MNKRKKDDLYESKWEVFLRNYHNVPGFKALVKLGGYFLFFLVFILIISLGTSNLNKEKGEHSEMSNSTTSTAAKKYKDILVEFANNNSTIKLIYTTNVNKTKIDAVYENNILTGTMENEIGIKKFKVQESGIYEVLLENETLNPELFGMININFLNPTSLVNILNENQATKRIEEEKILYSYSVNYNNINYNITIAIINETVTNIEIINDNEVYSISYE